jgi:hypothetical protein
MARRLAGPNFQNTQIRYSIGFLPDVGPGTFYGFRVQRPYQPEQGIAHNKLLLDPCARAHAGDLEWNPVVFGYKMESGDDLTFDEARASCRNVLWSTLNSIGRERQNAPCRSFHDIKARAAKLKADRAASPGGDRRQSLGSAIALPLGGHSSPFKLPEGRRQGAATACSLVLNPAFRDQRCQDRLRGKASGGRLDLAAVPHRDALESAEAVSAPPIQRPER